MPHDNKIIYICDPSSDMMTEMIEYCENNRLSLCKHSITDVTDVSLLWDEIAEFCFTDEADALVFKLRYK